MGLYQEIFEQPVVLENILMNEWRHIRKIAKELREFEINSIFLAARGTSDNAGLYGKYLFGTENQMPIALAAPSIFSLYKQPPKLENVLVMGISQSGQSPDIVEVLKNGNQQGVPTLAISNDPDSPLAKTARFLINIRAGEEKAVAATKTYTAQLLTIAMLSIALNGNQQGYEELLKIPSYIQQVLEFDDEIKESAQRFYYMKRAIVLGRGYNYATAFEWALKQKELCYVATEPYSSADFLHGPIAMVEKGFPVFVVVPKGKVLGEMLDLIKRLREEKDAALFIVSNHQDALSFGDIKIPLLEEMPEWISPIVSIVVGQLFCYWLANIKNLDTDNPRGLNKVTLTT